MMRILNAILLSLFLLTFISCEGGDLSIGGGAAGEIQYLEGIVTVNGQAADIGLEIQNGDVVVTGPDSFVEIKFGEYRVLNAGENTRLVLNAVEKTFELNNGAMAVVQSKARWLSRRKPWLVETPIVAASVRGTVFYIKVEKTDSVYFCLCNGKIHLEDTEEGGILNLEAAHHNAVRFIRSDDGLVCRKAPMLYHTDQDIESLADTIHVPIDWTVIPE